MSVSRDSFEVRSLAIEKERAYLKVMSGVECFTYSPQNFIDEAWDELLLVDVYEA